MKWFASFIFGVLFIVIILFLSSEFIDPYGLKNTQNKRAENLNSEEAFLYPLKIQPNSYYLLGTSRTLAFDIKSIEENLKKKTYFLGISGSNINQWLLLTQKIKEKKSNIILGLDLFSLNQIQNQKNTKPQILLNEAFGDFNFFTKNFYFLNSNFIQTLCSTIFRDLFTPKNHLFSTQNAKNLQEKFEIKTKPYQDFKLDKQRYFKLLAHLSSEDIVMVFPEYWQYYPFYLQQQSQDGKSLLEEYIQIIKILAKETKAQIWMFGGINPITLEDKNFDYDYWHFKPKVADMIIDKIFKKTLTPQDFGFKINRNQIDRQLEEWKKQITDYQKYKVKTSFEIK